IKKVYSPLSCNLLKNLNSFGHRRERLATRNEIHSFISAQTEKPFVAKAACKKIQRSLLELTLKIDQHIAAKHRLKLTKYFVGDRIVHADRNVATQLRLEPRREFFVLKVIGDAALTAGGGVIFFKLIDLPKRERPFGGGIDGEIVDIRAVKLATIVDPRF